MALSAFAIDRAKPKQKPYKLSDGDGLYLFVQPNGSKWWRFRYQFDRKEKMLSFGTYPEVSLVAARDKRAAARKLVVEGKDPSVQRKEDKAVAAIAAANTFGAAVKDYLKKLKAEGRSTSTLDKNTWLLEDLAAPLTKRPIADIKPYEILVILKEIQDAGKRETATRLRGTIGSVFRYAIANLKAEQDPTYALRGALLQPQVTHRAAITDEVQLGGLMLSVEAYKGRSVVGPALQFIALTLCRPGEARLMRKNEVNWIKSVWTIPADRMKMRREFQIPLSRQALAVLRAVWDKSCDFVFPSQSSLYKPMSDNTFNKALRIMGYDGQMHVTHGFRTSADTIMNERHMAPFDVIEVALAHQEEDENRRIYNRAQYLAERTVLMQQWADLLDQFKLQHEQAA
ncbi:integrase [Bradyrhizobium sp. UNPF46]|uniref:tyrosine-type recombinase/integrase n=1 Tax=Bradyrhizobium sp. UNPF46 TaxID=1141168 RepID=UPI0011526A2B|nr:integrase arm-type DNA-binding domain-containing protein [Bradyrhizobium sp. UNPF46]TQF37936.1 integrase [Bradyrhizobium sp. UNPF46]